MRIIFHIRHYNIPLCYNNTILPLDSQFFLSNSIIARIDKLLSLQCDTMNDSDYTMISNKIVLPFRFDWAINKNRKSFLK